VIPNQTESRAQRAAYALNRFLRMSQEDIATRLGASFSTVNAWINGKSEPRASYGRALEDLVRSAKPDPQDKEAVLRAVVAQLHVEYGSRPLGNEDNPLDELFFILLSLKTSQYTYGETYRAFRLAFYPWRRLLEVGPEEVERHIRRGGLGSLKARAFVDIARRLKADFGEVSLAKLKSMPTSQAETYLLSLPAVGVKTARWVLMHALGRDTLPVDTHTYRVGVRLGLVETSRGTGDVHRKFDEVIRPGLAYALHTNSVAHGRKVCKETAPECSSCALLDLCAHGQRAMRAGIRPAAGRARPGRALPVRDRERPVAVDIYAGCGGLSAGLEDAGFELKYALDWDKNACATHEKNFPNATVECRDVREVDGRHIKKVVGSKVDLVAGGPNCQGLSQRGLRNPHDPRNFMLPEFVRLVSDLQPRAFIMENVPGLAHRHNFGLLTSIFDMFERLGYRCGADVLLAADYGVPQLRYRFFLIGVRDTIALSLPAPTHGPGSVGGLFERPYVAVNDAIGDLPLVGADHQIDRPMAYAGDPTNDFLRYAREGSEIVVNHVCSATAAINLERAAHIPEGGNWKDIPPALLPPRLFTCRMTDHSTTYARLSRSHPAFTITSLFGNITAGAFTHPLVTRALTVREGARLQSFRDRFHFMGARNTQYRQIGNAVPPLLARAVGAHVLAILRGGRVAGVAPRITRELFNDQRAWDALPILTPRFKPLFGTGTRWPKGWGPEPTSYAEKLDSNYSLRPEFVPEYVRLERRKPAGVAESLEEEGAAAD
jgi:DNA (cytosine-5)-methyltransferase 1